MFEEKGGNYYEKPAGIFSFIEWIRKTIEKMQCWTVGVPEGNFAKATIKDKYAFFQGFITHHIVLQLSRQEQL